MGLRTILVARRDDRIQDDRLQPGWDGSQQGAGGRVQGHAGDRMAAMVGKGMTEEEALATKPFADLDDKWAGDERDSVNFIRVAYNSFKRS
jgi:hypothetical protein